MNRRKGLVIFVVGLGWILAGAACTSSRSRAPAVAETALIPALSTVAWQVTAVTQVTPTAIPTVPTATPTLPTATPTLPTATATGPTATPTSPTATPTVPTATPTRPTVTPATLTATVTVTGVPGDDGNPPGDGPSPVSGSIELEDGRCCTGGIAGQTITITAALSAQSSSGQVIEMRFSTAGLGCRWAPPALEGVPWEPYDTLKEFLFQLPINWVGFNVWVQFRDDQGHLSPRYCDDISVEGMPAPPPGS